MAKAMHIARDSVVATEEATANRQYQYGTTGVGMMGGCCMCSAVHPQSLFRFYWDCVILLLIGYTCVVLPLAMAEFGFMDGLGWVVIEQVVNFVFFLDLILNAHTGYVDDATRTLIMDVRLTRTHYLRTWCLLDLLATLPGELLVYVASGAQWTGGQRFLLRCLRFFRVSRLFRLFRLLKRLEINSGLPTASKTGVKFCAVVFVCSHWYCCAWFLIGSTQHQSDGNETNTLNVVPDVYHPNGYGPKNWIDHQHMKGESSLDQYIASLYWSLSTMSTIAYGDITPRSSSERIFAMFVMVTGTSVYAYGVASVVTLATGANETEREFMRQKDELNMFMRQMHMPSELRSQLREYFMHYQAALMTFNEKHLLHQLSPHLQARVTNLANAGLIRQVPFFAQQEERCITAVMLALQPHLFVPDEVICHMGEVGTEMYILKSGEVLVFVLGPQNEMMEIATLRKGNFFGEMAIFRGSGATRGAYIKALMYSIVYSISGEAIRALARRYDSLQGAIQAVADSRASELSSMGGAPMEELAQSFSTRASEPAPSSRRRRSLPGVEPDAADRPRKRSTLLDHIDLKRDGEMLKVDPTHQLKQVLSQSAQVLKQSSEAQEQASEGFDRLSRVEEQMGQMAAILRKLMAGAELSRVEMREVKDAVNEAFESMPNEDK